METSDPFIKNKIEKEIRTKKLRNKFGDENPTKIKKLEKSYRTHKFNKYNTKCKKNMSK
jgi:hypothetical protein